MIFVYDCLIRIFGFSIRVASLFNRKAKLWVGGRQDIFSLLERDLGRKERIAWFHCASLGEFEQGKPLMEALKLRRPDLRLLVTFFSPSGYEVKKSDPLCDHVFYLPLDTRKNADRFVKAVRPEMAVFVKYEFWYHHINALAEHKVPVYLVSANFRGDQLFFKWYGGLFRKMLKMMTWIFVQNQKSLQLLESIGIGHSGISGDTRFDRVTMAAEHAEELPLISQFKDGQQLLVAGSTWKEDEALLLEVINGKHFELKYILAPHVIDHSKIDTLMDGIQLRAIKLSEANEANIGNADVLIIDNIGMLSKIYQYGELAYVGGGFGRGLHNILEPAAFGLPVIFGPRFEKYDEAIELVRQGGAFSISNAEELKEKIRFLIIDDIILRMASEMSKHFVRENKGATRKILDHICPESALS